MQLSASFLGGKLKIGPKAGGVSSKKNIYNSKVISVQAWRNFGKFFALNLRIRLFFQSLVSRKTFPFQIHKKLLHEMEWRIFFDFLEMA